MESYLYEIGKLDLEDVISDLLDEYGDKVRVICNEEVEQLGKDTRKKLREAAVAAGIKGNRYVKAFSHKVTNIAGGFYVTVTVYNKIPGLTQLLEFGHPIMKYGIQRGWSLERPHFLPVQKWLEQEFPKRIKKRLEKI